MAPYDTLLVTYLGVDEIWARYILIVVKILEFLCHASFVDRLVNTYVVLLFGPPNYLFQATHC